MSKETRLMLLALFAMFILFGIAGNMDYQDELDNQRHYCEMVEIWENDAARGVPAEQRAGWPPFKGETVQCPNL